MKLEYKGFHTTAYTNLDEGVFYGTLEGIDDLVSWECNCISELRKTFYDAVEDHFKTCKEFSKDVSLTRVD